MYTKYFLQGYSFYRSTSLIVLHEWVVWVVSTLPPPTFSRNPSIPYPFRQLAGSSAHLISKPVPSTSVTSSQVTLSTLEDVLGEREQAFFTLMAAFDPTPAVVVAVVVGLEVLEDFFDTRGAEAALERGFGGCWCWWDWYSR